MLILLFVIFVGLFILGSIFIIDDDLELFRAGVQVCTVVGAAISILSFVIVTIEFSGTFTIDEKIAMYMEENQNIENQIDEIVRNYMEYESDTFIELKGDDAITLVNLYPELKSDELIKAQINTYQTNNAKLKELKETKINARVYKWWIYFGK